MAKKKKKVSAKQEVIDFVEKYYKENQFYPDRHLVAAKLKISVNTLAKRISRLNIPGI